MSPYSRSQIYSTNITYVIVRIFFSVKHYEMSSNGNSSNIRNHNDTTTFESRSSTYTSDVGRAVTDAVHERFRQSFVYCDDCKEKFIGNGVSIHRHFNKSHTSDEYCIYCQGKVFHYYKVKNGDKESEKFFYHRCQDWLTK